MRLHIISFLVVYALMRPASCLIVQKKNCFSMNQTKRRDHLSKLLKRNVSINSVVGEVGKCNNDIQTNEEKNMIVEENVTTLLPLSKNPLLLVSSKPLLDKNECDILLKYLKLTKDGAKDPLNDVFFESGGKYVFSTAHESKISNENISDTKKEVADIDENFCDEARQLIFRVRKEIDRLTNSPSHSGDFALPRFLSFQVEKIPDPSEDDVPKVLKSLLPDGLHSDNTNNMFTRHISALLYLSDEVDEYESDGIVGGATTFPLAVPLGKESDDQLEWDQRVAAAAKHIVSNKVFHTGVRDFPDTTLIESAAYGLFHKEIMEKGPVDQSIADSYLPSSSVGVRVNPKPGQLCVFHNLLDDGTPDPLAFHGGEAILGRNNIASGTGQKVLLVFFKTMPSIDRTQSPDHKELARKSSESRKWIQESYYSR